VQRYNPKIIEKKWQDKWEEAGIYRATDDTSKPKKYILEYFPYPSGAAMHVGHVRNYTIGDVLARFNRMAGYNVLHPMGWDAFGLPAENFAIKNQISPRVAIDQNTARFKEQLMQMGFSYDWSREIDSTDPRYYKWTQWFFLLLHKRGLAYQQESLQWWCPFDKTVLANEQVEAGRCWRCGNEVEKKALKQWFFKITDYADRLAADLDNVDWSDAIKAMQRNWIGRSTGAEIDFTIEGHDEKLTVFTTRPDTLYGATFMVLSPEHPLVEQITTAEHKQKVNTYRKAAQAKSDIERQETNREKTGAFTGAYAINPATDEQIPIWVADYVLMGYGTGAIMAVPAHDERDHAFAEKFHLPIVRVVQNDAPDDAFTHDEGMMINSGPYDGIPSDVARERIVQDLAAKGLGQERVNYKMRDWLISRQRYWGAPIPMIHCAKCGTVPVPEDQLPVELPELEKFEPRTSQRDVSVDASEASSEKQSVVSVYEPRGDGRSPLANVEEWVNVECPQCQGPAERETDTMDGFACSSWYFLRFADPHNDVRAFDTDKVKFWLPVDDYIGGAEHAVMHLLYARFWTKVMQDEGLIDFNEPFTKLRNQGMILAPDGQKMSKSKGNTIEPGVLIDQGYGADAVRIMELFIGPWNQAANWSVEGMGGAFRFLQRVWTLAQEYQTAERGEQNSEELLRAIHKATKKVSADIEDMNFNTAIAALMELTNELFKIKAADNYAAKEWQSVLSTLILLLAPFAPHIAEELWQQLGNDDSVHMQAWPAYDEVYVIEDTMTIAVQVNGKLRGEIKIARHADETSIIDSAKTDERVTAYITGKEIRKSIYVPGRLVNFVV
jgi:leucyl-tRNA synthetase